MTNREFYKEQILDIACNGSVIAMDKETNELCSCSIMDCDNCLFGGNDCNTKVREWCNAEYIEPCPFKDGELVEVSDNGVNWTLRYFSHINNNMTYKYLVHKDGLKNSNEIDGWKYCQKYGTLGGLNKENKG